MCGESLELASAPPKRFVGGYHDYCGECAAAFFAFTEGPRRRVPARYPRWLVEAAFGAGVVDDERPAPEAPPGGCRMRRMSEAP
ncbi:hypothetical protein FHX42_004039 [Saccharopolyspora lacisalsi]|uniref:Uncharacterized protein n=1 Tax=Halosaccharopolyspora lacisalsi TaxID=1000566 RepID=A0A839E0N6_9PSEU|nr:hypothetical protein [Halosaccharopolyspora lacisalsi]MBA8826660.1 hypothetical protein [Halosaccharopolyspora lacisalsi]